MTVCHLVLLTLILIAETLVFATVSHATECFYNSLPRTILREAFRATKVRAMSPLHCLIIQCPCGEGCAASYHPLSGDCVAVNDRLFTLALNMHVPIVTDDADWTTLVRTGFDWKTDGPTALWLLSDKGARARNLGNADTSLDMVETGLVWNSSGPPGAKAGESFVTMTPTNRAYVQLVHAGKCSLDLTKVVSTAMWVKTQPVNEMMSILDYSDDDTPDLLRFLIARNDNSRPYEQASVYLHLDTGKHYYLTQSNYTDRFEWRHIAFVYRGANDVRFYLNGNVWPIGIQLTLSNVIQQPSQVQIGRRNSQWFLMGGLACLCVFERALSQQEIRDVMRNCP